MTEKDYLPQYAAEAVRDLEEMSRRCKHLANSPLEFKFNRGDQYGQMASASSSAATLLRAATHIVLPPNGEIYRDNKHTGPSDQECPSLTGLPAPITSFEYSWTHDLNGELNPSYDYRGEESHLENPKKRITLVVDEKQLDPEGAKLKDKTRIIFISICNYDSVKKWSITPHTLTVFDPFEVTRHPNRKGWASAVEVYDAFAREVLSPTEMQRAGAVFSEYQSDVSLVVQACHALRVGATLESRRDKSYTRNRTFEKAGVGGFEYHVLKLPHGTVKETLGNRQGDRDGPRYHFRRAHLRNLSSGAQTFVRSCFVGNREKGEVVKNYQMEAIPQ